MKKRLNLVFNIACLLIVIIAVALGNNSDGDAPNPSRPAQVSAPALQTAQNAPRHDTQKPLVRDNEIEDAFEEVNRVRAAMGLEPFLYHPRLEAAAQAHAEYLTLNGNPHDGRAHKEEPGKPGFTGMTVADRAKHQGYTHGVNEGVSSYLTRLDTPVLSKHRGALTWAIDSFIGTVYHRQAFLDSLFVDIGLGWSLNTATPDIDRKDWYENSVVVNFGAGHAITQALREHAPVAWPYPGQRDVPTSFSPRLEWPNPAPDLDGVAGYPVSVNLPRHWRFDTVTQFELRCAGKILPARILTTQSDVHTTDKGFYLAPHFAFLLPEHPLPEHSACEVRFTANYSIRTQSGGYQPAGQIGEDWWQFHTGATREPIRRN